ncbi:MAG: H4MPT-linked C1 transfer pathway protein [Planctomycetota bacterium]|nr:MAG: H4MPT-linked C1 transfer pathway protein [Planctomycetota bacterium]
MQVIGLDVGGANIKAATTAGAAATVPFALWKAPERLPEALAEALRCLNIGMSPDLIAVTMTGELADCFSQKAEGVAFIIDSVRAAFPGGTLAVWQVAGEFVDADTARRFPLLTAASNWHALATFCGRIVPRTPAVLIDMGSTTTDIVPLEGGLPVPNGLTDVERLRCGELVYTGCRRTPLCALVDAVRFGTEVYPLAAEVFATSGDAWLVLEWLEERPEDCGTADGRPATRRDARRRVARQFCADEAELPGGLLEAVCRAAVEKQKALVRAALDRVVERSQGAPREVILCGEGIRLVRDVLEGHHVWRGWQRWELDRMLGSGISVAACAYAVARLAEERVAPFL